MVLYSGPNKRCIEGSNHPPALVLRRQPRWVSPRKAARKKDDQEAPPPIRRTLSVASSVDVMHNRLKSSDDGDGDAQEDAQEGAQEGTQEGAQEGDTDRDEGEQQVGKDAR